jgi:hypothetical protein
VNAVSASFEDSPHVTSPCGDLAAWFTEPPGAIIRFVRPARLELAGARWLTGPAIDLLNDRFGPTQKLILVLDLGRMRTRDPAVRPMIVEAAKSLRPRLARAVVIPPAQASAVYLASLRAAASLLRVFGVEVELRASLADVLRVITLSAASA